MHLAIASSILLTLPIVLLRDGERTIKVPQILPKAICLGRIRNLEFGIRNYFCFSFRVEVTRIPTISDASVSKG
ncbi:MAG: hypothetical protein CLLPBCKN_000043 [Chroococcidiopsis cubana SAG 39.79]|nr:hypothetical protein [Chroococcidiopsis cubana SAG 39.79]